ncbi:FHA domain-containing protein [Nocardia aurantiaca]|uniref:FHA domain-containing protein n=1 Tax=Nocardia aurantiaca TaxID=2675850 RepID=A0A6I3KX32_9NOCA|nr:FHA domain-containing protein [Nocardia aurantiaca]MTE13266.1 FHA domain-containing protein [Nocardia aurantiaca]
MGRIPTTVGLVPGAGLVARFGVVVIFLHGESPSTDRILGAAETAAGAADPGVAVAQRLAATVFTSSSAQPPAFGVVAPTAGGILILLRGAVTAAVDGPEGARTLSGERAMTWADEIVRDPVRRLTVVADGAGGEIAHTDLRSGVVVGGGFVLHAPVSGLAAPRTGETKPKAAPIPDATRRAPIPTPSHTRFSGPVPAKGTEAGRGRPVSPAPAESAPEPAPPRNAATTPAPGSRPGGGSGSDQPAGVLDERMRIETQADPEPETRATPAERPSPERPHGLRAAGPDLEKPPADSSSPARRDDRPDPEDQPPTAAYVPGPDSFEDPSARGAAGPPSPTTSAMAAGGGALTSMEGAVYPLDRPYVIGRDPMIDEAVRRAVASPIVIARDRHVSRVHARVFVQNGLVYVRDAGTPGGTFVAAPGAADWVRVGQQPMELQVGWSLRIGERILTYRISQTSP